MSEWGSTAILTYEMSEWGSVAILTYEMSEWGSIAILTYEMCEFGSVTLDRYVRLHRTETSGDNCERLYTDPPRRKRLWNSRRDVRHSLLLVSSAGSARYSSRSDSCACPEDVSNTSATITSHRNSTKSFLIRSAENYCGSATHGSGTLSSL
ncbi:hypothetical protein RRG08_023424 [Elysia crispata]|uniref:Uncharacterized protein n=1 Tax=Elysia crispata TaxID=231223 RepID=A0AAE0YE08_9GAST|nr:hypothetical protein RRG08_023424 [Elysia crispata]